MIFDYYLAHNKEGILLKLNEKKIDYLKRYEIFFVLFCIKYNLG